MKKSKKNDSDLLHLLNQAQEDRDKFSKDATLYKRLYESQQAYNKTISDQLRHAERQVRALVDALTDKYYPIPAQINVSMDYRVATPEKEQ